MKLASIIVLALTCVIETAILFNRQAPAPTGSSTVTEATTPATAPVEDLPPIQVTARQTPVRPRVAADLPPETAAGPSTAPATDLPAELTLPSSLTAKLRQLRSAGVDSWLLAHVASTQFERQWQAWARVQKGDDVFASLAKDKDKWRQQTVAMAAGADALRRMEIKDWARYTGDQYTPGQAAALYDLDQWLRVQMVELQNSGGGDTTELQRQYQQRRREILGRDE